MGTESALLPAGNHRVHSRRGGNGNMVQSSQKLFSGDLSKQSFLPYECQRGCVNWKEHVSRNDATVRKDIFRRRKDAHSVRLELHTTDLVCQESKILRISAIKHI